MIDTVESVFYFVKGALFFTAQCISHRTFQVCTWKVSDFFVYPKVP
jgi:hypothetical protein